MTKVIDWGRRIAVAGIALVLTAVGVLASGASPAQAVTSYYYAGGQQVFTGTLPTGLYANTSVRNPYVNSSNDEHSLMELSATLSSANGNQIVEVGTDVDPVLYGNSSTHLFVYHWANGQPCGNYLGGNNVTLCSGGSAFVPCTVGTCGAAGNYTVGQVLTASTNIKFGLDYRTTSPAGWWVWAGPTSGSCVGNCWVGYFPATAWTGVSPTAAFTTMETANLFAEVAHTTGTVCSDAGSGDFASSAASTRAFWGSYDALGVTTENMSSIVTAPSYYDNLFAGTLGAYKTVYVGGPGQNGNKGSC